MVEFNLILMEVHLAAISRLHTLHWELYPSSISPAHHPSNLSQLNVHVRFDFCVDDATTMMKVYLCICVVVFLRSTYHWCSHVMVL